MYVKQVAVIGACCDSFDVLATRRQRATWTRPDGTVFHTGTTIDRAPNGIAPPPADELQLELVS